MVEKSFTVSGLQLWQWRNKAIEEALAADVSPREVDWLLQEVTNLDRLALRLQSFQNLPQIPTGFSLADLEQLWQQRLHERLPIQYIAGTTPWRLFKLAVSNAVLIPRPETECLIDLALSAVVNSEIREVLEAGLWADLGTGSGAIALGLAEVLPKATIYAVDVSTEALAIAQKNAQSQEGLSQRLHFYQGSWWKPLVHLKGKFSGMVSNPPYIPSEMLPSLQPEVFAHEPHLALDGGIDGLDCIRHLIEISPQYLHSGGVWLIEMMAGQAEIVRELLDNQGSYYNISIHADLAGIERFAVAYLK
ncbi:MAG TPA: peptide chain release factor N(5)-glutamine methyltransferase [Nostocaceae cyanobacterium]|nr:peptide chain release factor N(5)-glutamine methyltransferase [Nostocaceae cyanobacterium]